MQFNISEPGMTRANKGKQPSSTKRKETECHNKNVPYSDRLLLFILLSILGNCQKNSSVQQMAAVASDMASAAYTPATPIKCGSINANGISRITLRSNAMKWIFWPAPTPRTYSDRHAVNRKSSYRPRIQASSSEQFLSALHRS